MKKAGLLLVGLAMVSACSEEPEATPTPVEGVIDGMSVENARLVLAPVSGNPAAVYFDLSYQGERALSLYDAEVEGVGDTTMHQFGEYNFKVQMMEALPIALTKGTEVEFKPGDYHLMAMEVSPDLAAGDTAKVTLKVSGGDTHVFDAEVRVAGDER